MKNGNNGIRKSQSMLEINEISVIHELNNAYEDMDYGCLDDSGHSLVEEIRSPITSEETFSPDSIFIKDDQGAPTSFSNNRIAEKKLETEPVVRKQNSTQQDDVSSSSSFRKRQPIFLRFRKSASSVSLAIPEETTLSIPDNNRRLSTTWHGEQSKSRSNSLDVDSLDSTRHSYNVGLDDCLDCSIEDGLDDCLDSNRRSYNLNLGLEMNLDPEDSKLGSYSIEDGLDDCLDSNRRSYNLNLGLAMHKDPHTTKKPKDNIFGGFMQGNLDDEEEDDLFGLALDEPSNPETYYVPTFKDEGILNQIPREVEEKESSPNINSSTTDEPIKRRRSLTKLIKSVSMLNLPSTMSRNKSNNQLNSGLGFSTHGFASHPHAPKHLKSILKKSRTEEIKSDSTCSSSDESSCSVQKMKRELSFSSIEIREYNITLGDNPGGANGPPISLDWKHCRRHVMELDLFEEHRGPRRTRNQMHMSSSVRSYRLMKEQGISLEDIRKAAKSAQKIRNKRKGTLKADRQRKVLNNTLSLLLPSKASTSERSRD